MSEAKLRGAAAVVGVGESKYQKRGTSVESSRSLVLRAVLAACRDAGIKPRQVDGFVSYGDDANDGPSVATALDVSELRWSSMVWGGGGGGSAAALTQAAVAVATGQATCVAVYRGLSQRDDGRLGFAQYYLGSQYTANGVLAPAQICALRTQRMLEVDKVPPSALRALVLASYEHAQRNPRAVAYGRPLDEAAYEGSRMISEPFHLYDCSRENDGAGALLVVAADRAADCASPPAYFLSGVQGRSAGWGESLENEAAYTSAGFHPELVARLWREAGVSATDVDVVQAYENFSGPAVASLIDVGLCPPGPDASSVMTPENLLAPTGNLPVNTSGGNLAEGFIHGIGLTIEAVRQIRQESPNTVPGANVSLLLGGPMAPLVSAVLLGSPATVS